MGPKNEQQQDEGSGTKAHRDSTRSEGEAAEQAVAEATDPSNELATYEAGALSPQASSAGFSDDVFDSRSGSSGSISFTST